MNIGAAGGLPSQPATWAAGPNGGGGLTLIDPTNFGVQVQAAAGAPSTWSELGFDYVSLGLAAGATMEAGTAFAIADQTTGHSVIGLDYDTSVFANGGALKWRDANNVHKCALYAGAGVPANAGGSNGDFALRTDTPGTVNQRLYVKSAGAWVGIL